MSREVDLHVRSAPRERRRANIVVSSDLLARLLGLSDGVSVVTFALDHLRDAVVFSLTSDDERFPVVPQGEEAPYLTAWSEPYEDEAGVTRVRTVWPEIGGSA